MRNVEAQAELGKSLISANRDLTVDELDRMFGTFKSYSSMADGIYYSLTQAFYFGVAVGIRQGKEDKTKQK